MSDPVSSYMSSVKTMDRLIATVKSNVGVFLENEQILYDVQPQIENLQRADRPDIKSTANLLAGKQQALLNLQKNLEAESIALMNKAAAVKAMLDTDPKFSFLQTPAKNWGIRQYQLLADAGKAVAAVVPTATTLSGRLVTQNKNVKTLTQEAADLEKAATGAGFIPKIQGIISSSIMSSVGAVAKSLAPTLWPVAVVAAVGGVLYLGFMSGGFMRKKS